MDIETVAEIFILVNSEGVPLSQADFAMSKTTVNETYNGPGLRKAMDYFCHTAVGPEFLNTLRNDREFVQSEFFKPMVWLQKENDNLYAP